MSRPQRNNVDHFPFQSSSSEAILCIEKKYGNEGFAAYIKILQEIAGAEYHFVNLKDKKQSLLLSAKCLIPEQLLFDIISDLSLLDLIDRNLWKENRILWSPALIESVKDQYARRKNECIDLRSLKNLLSEKGIIEPSKAPQKLKPISKSKTTRNKQFKPPQVAEIFDYMLEKGMDYDAAKKESKRLFDFYDSKNWMIGKNKMSKWKSAVSGWINRGGFQLTENVASSKEYQWRWKNSGKKIGTKEQYEADKKTWDQPGFDFQLLKSPN